MSRPTRRNSRTVTPGAAPTLPGGNALAARVVADAGFSAAYVFANVALQAALLGMQRALSHQKLHRRIGDAAGLLAPFAKRQRLVDSKGFQALERRYK